jgi:hypothetical protein
MDSSWCYPEPHRGDLTSSSFVFESQPGGFHHAPYVGRHLAVRVLLIGTTREWCVKSPGLDLHQRGAYAPIWSYGEVCIHAGSHLPMVTQGTLRSWLGIAVPSLRPLASSRMREPRQLDKYPISSTPSDYRNTWGRGLCVRYIFSDNPDRSGDFMTCQLKSK